MSLSYFLKMTATGAAKIAAATSGGPAVNLTHIALGDGGGAAVPAPTGAETALVNEVFRDLIAALYVNPEDLSVMLAEMTIDSETGGWVVRELGIFDADGELFAYGNFPETYKPVAGEGTTREMVIRGLVRVLNASVVNLVVDTSIVLASRAWVHATITAAALLPGGTTYQLLAKASNANGHFVWVDITEGVPVLIDVIQELVVLADLQTIVNFTTVSTEGLAVYLEGARLIQGSDYEVSGGAQITLASSYPAGTKLHVYQNDPQETLEYLKPGLNLADLPDKAAARASLGVASAGDLELFFMAQS